jgi:MFS family permease
MTTDALAASHRRTWFAVVAAASMFGITYGLSSPLIALELQRRGHGEFVIGLNAAMHALGVLTVAWMLPRAASRWGMRGILMGALLLVGVVLVLFPMAAWVWLWFPLRYVLGIGSEGVLVTTESWTGHLSSEASRAMNIAIYTAAVSVGLAIGPLLLGHVGSGDAVPFLIGAALSAVACMFIALDRTPAPRFEHRPLAGGMIGLLRHAPVALAATALNAALETSGLTFLPMYAMKLGWGEQGATALVATLLVGAIVLQLPIGWLGDRVDRRRLVLWLSALSDAGCAGMAVRDRRAVARPRAAVRVGRRVRRHLHAGGDDRRQPLLGRATGAGVCRDVGGVRHRRAARAAAGGRRDERPARWPAAVRRARVRGLWRVRVAQQGTGLIRSTIVPRTVARRVDLRRCTGRGGSRRASPSYRRFARPGMV